MPLSDAQATLWRRQAAYHRLFSFPLWVPAVRLYLCPVSCLIHESSIFYGGSVPRWGELMGGSGVGDWTGCKLILRRLQSWGMNVKGLGFMLRGDTVLLVIWFHIVFFLSQLPVFNQLLYIYCVCILYTSFWQICTASPPTPASFGNSQWRQSFYLHAITFIPAASGSNTFLSPCFQLRLSTKSSLEQWGQKTRDFLEWFSGCRPASAAPG